MADRVATGEIKIDLNDKSAIAGLRAIEADFDRTMAKIEHSRAEAQIGADLSELKRDLAEAKALQKKYEAESARLKKINLDNYRGAVRQQYEQEKRQNAALLGQQRRRTADLQRSVAVRNQELRGLKAIGRQNELNARAEAAKQELIQRTARIEQQAAAARKRAFGEDERNQLKILNLQKQYAKVAREAERAARRDITRRPGGVTRREAKVEVELDKARALAQMEVLKKELAALGGHPPVGINVDIDRKSRIFESIRDLPRDLAGKLRGLQDVRINLGPITTSIRGMAIGLATLGPILLGIVGTLGAFTAAAGSAAAGAGAIATAFAVGGIPALAGFLAVLVPMKSQIQDVFKAQKAYNDAVLKYGKASDQAKTKSKQLDNTLKGVDSSTRQAFKSASGLTTRWQELTAPSRAVAFNVIGQALKTASSDLTTFGHGTNLVFTATGRAINDWLKGLRSVEAKGILRDTMKNLAVSIGPALHGIGQLGVALGRIGRVASTFLPGLARGFDQWATSIADGTKNSSRLYQTISRMVTSLRNFGHLAQAAGRFLITFFGQGVSAGNDLVNTLTGVLNNWTALIRANPQGLQNFFRDSVSNTKAFASALAPLVAMFVQWTTNLMPAVTGFLQGASAVGKFVTQVLKLIGLTGGIKDLAIVLGAVWAIGRAGAAIGAVTAMARALFGLAAAETAVAGAGARGGAAGGLGLLFGAGGGAGGAGRVGVLRGAITKLVPAIAGLGTLAGGAATLGITALAGAAVYGAYKLLSMKSASDKLHDTLKRVAQDTSKMVPDANNFNTALDDSTRKTKDYDSAAKSVEATKKRLAKLEQQGKKDTQAYRTETDRLRDALARRQTAEDQARKAASLQTALGAKVISDTLARTRATKAVQDAERNLADAEQRAQANGRAGSAATKEVTKARQDLKKAQDALAASDRAAEQSQIRLAASSSVAARAARGMIPLTDQAAASVGKLARNSKNIAVKISTKFEDPKDVQRVAASANRALQSGVKSKIVMRIVADSKNAETAIARLKAARLAPKTLSILEKGGSDAVAMLRRIKGTKLTPQEQRIAEKGGSRVLGVLGRILGIKIPNKAFAIIAHDQASGVAAKVRAIIGGIPRSVTVDVKAILHRTGATRAAGRGKIGAETALVGEGGGPEILANARSGLVSLIKQPTIMPLDPHDYVIPTESKHRGRGRSLFSQFAKDMGIPGFASGRSKRKQKPLSEHAKATARGDARSTAAKKGFKHRGYESENIKELPQVEKAKQGEDDANREISIYTSTMKEPETLLSQVGTTADGDPIYAINQAEINRWSGELNHLADLYDVLLARIAAVATAVEKALKKVNRAIANATKNIGILNALKDGAQRTINRKGTSLHQRQKAAEAKKVYEGYIEDEKAVRRAAESDQKSLLEDQHDIPFRRREAIIARDEARADAAAVAGSAQAELAGTTKEPTPTEPVSPLAALNTRLEGLNAEQSLAAIGQGLLGGAPRTQEQINADIVSTNQSIIDTARGMLSDTNPLNDAEAFQAISGAAGAIQNISGSAGSAGVEALAFSGAAGSLISGFGSNVRMNGIMQPNSFSGIVPPGSTGMFPAAGSGPTISVTNYYQTQPTDPHTWSRNVLFELQAAT